MLLPLPPIADTWSQVELTTNLFLAAAFLASWLVTLFYGLFLQWYRHLAGITFLLLLLGLSGYLTLGFLGVWWDRDYVGRDFWRAFIIGYLVTSLLFVGITMVTGWVRTGRIVVEIPARPRKDHR